MLRRYGRNNIGPFTAIDQYPRSWNGFIPWTPSVPILFYTPSIPKTRLNAPPDRMETSPTTFSSESYFETQPPPPTIEQDVQSVRTFLKQQRGHGRKVVLVTVRGLIAPPRGTEYADFSPVYRRAEERLSLWNSMCKRIDLLSSPTITGIYPNYMTSLPPSVCSASGSWTTSVLVSKAHFTITPLILPFPVGAVYTRSNTTFRNPRRHICRVLPQSRLRRDIHAQAIQSPTLQPTLFPLYEPFLGPA
jgi:hypothetical protein